MEVLYEVTLDKVRYNYFITKPYIEEPSVFIYFSDYHLPTILNNIDHLNLPLSKFSSIHVPAITKTVKGVSINTNKIYPDLLKLLEDKKIPIRLVKTLPRKIERSLLVDLNPLLYQLAPVFDRLKFNKFEFYFNTIDAYIKSTSKLTQNMYPIFYVDAVNTTPEFINDLTKYLQRNDFEIELPNADKLYVAYFDGNKTFYLLLGQKIKDKLVINKNVFYKLIRSYKKAHEKFVKSAAEEVFTKDPDKVIDSVIKKYNITSPDVKSNIKIILKQYLQAHPDEIETAIKNPTEFIQRALNDIANIDIKLTDLNQKEVAKKLEEVGKVFIKPEKITPKVNYEFAQVIPIEEEVQLETTVANRHKKEFETIQDYYLEKIVKSLEEGENPVQIVDIKKELKDNNVNRFYKYTITVKDNQGRLYDLNINIPALINDRYFKLNGKTYILVNQLFLKPITKAKHNSARFLTNYATITLELRNVKLPVTDINEILDYVVNKYKNHIKTIVENTDNEQIPNIELIKYKAIEFDNGYTIYGFNPIGNNEYIIVEKTDENGNVEFYTVYDANDKKLKRIDADNNEHEIPLKFREYLVNKIQKIISDYDANDILAKSLKSVPYIQLHIAGVKLPLIKFMILYHGLVGALEKLRIPYRIDDKEDLSAYYTVKFKDKYINIYPTNIKQRYIVNGLKLSKIPFDKYSLEEFEANENTRRSIFENEYGAYSVHNFDLIRRNIVDTITKELLEYEGRPTEFDEIINEMLDTLFNERPLSPVDLRITRLRLSEILHNILYKQISMAKNDYEIRSKVDKTAKIYIDPDYVIKQLLQGESTLQYVEPANPIDELNTATRVTPKGIGGIPKASIQLVHRLIPFEKDVDGKYVSSYFGNISALDTNEYSNVGVNQQLTNQALVSDKFGLFGLRYNIRDLKFETLGVGEALAPWISSIDHDRTVKMAQQMRQVIPIENPTPPIVQSGMESIIPQISSNRFTIRAEDDGEVVEVKDGEYIVVQYKNGQKRLYDIRPRLARIKRGRYLPLDIYVNVKPGDKIKKGQIIAGTKHTKDGLYTYGRNVVVALMPYNGGTFEDGWVVTEDTLEKFAHKIYKEVNVIIPDTATVEDFIDQIGTEVKRGQPLVTFSFKTTKDATDYMDNLEIDADEELFEMLSKNEIIVESPVDGIIKDIRIYINGKVDPKIETAWNKITKQLSQYINKASKINGKDDFSYLDNIDTTIFKRGSHKYRSRQFKGARILYLIEETRVPGLQDKFVFRGGNKGTVAYIIPKDKKPIALDSKLKIDWIHNSLSVIGRKNANILLELGVGKALYFLNKKAKEMASDSKVKTKEIKRLVLDVYNALDQTPNKEYYNKIKAKLDEIPDNKFRELCKQIDPLEKPLFIWLALPFSQMKVDWINDALKILGVPLEEKVYIPELDMVTENPVTVGVAYVTMLEFLPDAMLGYRSTERYSSLTGQAVKGRSNEGIGGARIDELTLAGLISYLGGDSKLIEELYTVQADDHIAKQDVQHHIIQTGEPPETYRRDETKTKQLLRELLIGKGLNPGF